MEKTENKLLQKSNEKLVHIQVVKDVWDCAGFARWALTREGKWHTI